MEESDRIFSLFVSDHTFYLIFHEMQQQSSHRLAFYYFYLEIIYSIMATNQSYILHPLNTSKSKQTHCFSREPRFSKNKRAITEAFYDLPSTIDKRTTGFGFGKKINIGGASKSPPPGKYDLPSQFDKNSQRHAISIGKGRDKVTFGSFLLEALKKNKDVPSPDRYEVSPKKSKVGGGMGSRINTDFSLKYKKSIPGPGSYLVTATDLSQGHYCLSNFRNASSPRYHSDAKPKVNFDARRNSTVSYDIQEKQIGRYTNSKYKNTVTRTFSRSKRPGMEHRSMLCTPGFKYRSFSQFGA